MTEPDPMSDPQRIALLLSQLMAELRASADNIVGTRLDGVQAAYERLRNEGLASPMIIVDGGV